MKKDDPEEQVEWLDDMMRKTLSNEPPPEIHQKLNSRIDAFGDYLALQPRHARWRRLMPDEMRWAYSLAAVILIVLMGFVTLGGNTTPTWAEVAERFSAVSYMHATIYVKPSPLEPVSQLELWLRDDGKMRFRAGDIMHFGKNFNIDTSIPYRGRMRGTSDPLGAQVLIQEVIEKIGKADVFSLEVLVRALPIDGELSLPLPSENVGISKDLVAFELAHESQAEWLRIWALRDSRLPVRLLYWNPQSGESIDVVLSYSAPQPEAFFDPAAFRQHMEAYPDNALQWAYGLMQDEDGLPLVSDKAVN